MAHYCRFLKSPNFLTTFKTLLQLISAYFSSSISYHCLPSASLSPRIYEFPPDLLWHSSIPLTWQIQITLQGLVQIPFLLWKLPLSLNRFIHFFCVLIAFCFYSYHAPCLGSGSRKLILRGRFAGRCFIKEMLSEETRKWVRDVGEGKERDWARVSSRGSRQPASTKTSIYVLL